MLHKSCGCLSIYLAIYKQYTHRTRHTRGSYLKFIYVIRYAKMGHVGTKYTTSHNRPYLSNGIEYLHSVTIAIIPIKYVINAENIMAIT